MVVPAGVNLLHVEKGPGILSPVNRPSKCAFRRSGGVAVRLNRWVNMPEQGYYSADLHVHFGYDRWRYWNSSAWPTTSISFPLHVLDARTEPEWKDEWPAWEAGRGSKSTELIL